MPPRKNLGLTLAQAPPWFDQDLVKLFTALQVDTRRGMKIFPHLTADEGFDDLAILLDRYCKAEMVTKDFNLIPKEARRPGVPHLLEPNLILQLAMTQHIGNTDSSGGLFLHWHGRRNADGLPLHYMRRTWTAEEIEHYMSNTPEDRLRITSGCLPWFIDSPEVPVASLTMLMPKQTSPQVVEFEWKNHGVATDVAMVLYLRGQCMYAKLSDMRQLTRVPFGQLRSGGPYYVRKASQEKWFFPAGSAECKQWIQRHELGESGAGVEKALLKKLHESFLDEDTLWQPWAKICSAVRSIVVS